MSTEHPQRLLLLGLPASGKTTYLAALWHLLTGQEVPASFRVDTLDGDRRYLDGIRDTWLELREMAHTPIDSEHAVTVTLVDGSGAEFKLQVPDLAGESFERHFTDHSWPESYAALCEHSTGVLLFIHSDKIRDPRPIRDADEVLDGLEEPPAAEVSPTVSAAALELPTQVLLVSLLQVVADTATRPLRVAVVLSAWDLVEAVSPTQTPERFLEARLPLLHQFLRANDLGLTARIYGISAQGGDLKTQHDALAAKVNPSERVRVVGPEASVHDLAAPLRFLVR